MTSVWEHVSAHASGRSRLYHPEGSVPLDELVERAERSARALASRLPPDRQPRIGLLMNNGEPWVRSFLAAMRLGAAVAPLPLPTAFRGPDAYCAHIGRISHDAGLDVVIVDDTIRRFLPRLTAACGAVEFVHVDSLTDQRSTLTEPDASALAVLQYTSGSTSMPKAVMLSQRNVIAGIYPITHDIGWDPATDAMGLWLPLFHDMGLFSMLAALARGSSVCLWTPSSFVRRPLLWLQEFASSVATVLVAPNFFFDYLTSAATQSPELLEGLDLSGWRVAFNGAETVQWSTVTSFTESFTPYGFDPATMFPVYGMAEATLPVTFPVPGQGPVRLEVDRSTLSPGSRVGHSTGSELRAVVNLGRPVAGIELRIADAEDHPVEPLMVGEVQVRGAAVTAGYLNRAPEEQPFTTDGWLKTGDLGFLNDVGLYFTGRAKDMVTVNGENYYAEDVEEIVRQAATTDRRQCAAIGLLDESSSESMLVLVETKETGTAAAALADDLRRRIIDQLGLAAIEVRPVAPQALPYTSSGKIKRRETKRLVEEKSPIVESATTIQEIK